MEETEEPNRRRSEGAVYLVGAGPGDVGLLTLRGAELLGRAEVVVYDALVNPELLRLAPASAEIIPRGKHPQEHVISQLEVNRLLIARAQQGKCVVRLKGGDPYIFGRGGEEAEELAAAGVRFEVVPGISSFVAGPSYAGIPLTHRDYASSVTILTGHETPGKEAGQLDLGPIARLPGTKVVLMGAARLRSLAEVLMRDGLAGQTPVAVVQWGTTPRQQTVEGTLADIADRVEQTHLTAPLVTVIGEVVRLRSRLGWFEKRPLFGQRVVVTRARRQAGPLADALRDLGAEVLEIPTIQIAPPRNHQDLVDAILGLNGYDWIVFTSPNGVSMFFELFFKSFEDLRDIGGVRIAAVGPGTAARLRELHLKVDLMPEESLSQEIAAAFAKHQSIENLRLLLLRAEVANPGLPKALEALGAIVDDVACYRTEPDTQDPTGAAARLLEQGADWITFTSGSTVTHFHARFDLLRLRQQFPALKLASIGPETSKSLAALGLSPDLEAAQHTIPGLLRALENRERAG